MRLCSIGWLWAHSWGGKQTTTGKYSYSWGYSLSTHRDLSAFLFLNATVPRSYPRWFLCITLQRQTVCRKCWSWWANTRRAFFPFRTVGDGEGAGASGGRFSPPIPFISEPAGNVACCRGETLLFFFFFSNTVAILCGAALLTGMSCTPHAAMGFL